VKLLVYRSFGHTQPTRIMATPSLLRSGHTIWANRPKAIEQYQTAILYGPETKRSEWSVELKEIEECFVRQAPFPLAVSSKSSTTHTFHVDTASHRCVVLPSSSSLTSPRRMSSSCGLLVRHVDEPNRRWRTKHSSISFSSSGPFGFFSSLPIQDRRLVLLNGLLALFAPNRCARCEAAWVAIDAVG